MFMMTSLTYTSHASPGLTLDDAQALWMDAFERNEKSGITGGLYFDGNSFFQVVEGDEETVMDLFKVISNDPRHDDLQLLVQNDIASPMFRNWPMKFVNLAHAEVDRPLIEPNALRRASFVDVNAAATRLFRF